MKVTYLQEHCTRAGQEICVRDLEDGESCLVKYESGREYMWKREKHLIYRSFSAISEANKEWMAMINMEREDHKFIYQIYNNKIGIIQ
jgi:hypothetical protein